MLRSSLVSFLINKPYEHTPMPDLILLDLNIPRVHGHDVLAALRHLGLHHIPVVILSSSSDDADIRKAYALCANAYVEKPMTKEMSAIRRRPLSVAYCTAVLDVQHFALWNSCDHAFATRLHYDNASLRDMARGAQVPTAKIMQDAPEEDILVEKED
ncbi:MAG TPA: response regulator [Methylomirabilota bacterium]|nr:response regulator [Methylomirabilota bacterium]